MLPAFLVFFSCILSGNFSGRESGLRNILHDKGGRHSSIFSMAKVSLEELSISKAGCKVHISISKAGLEVFALAKEDSVVISMAKVGSVVSSMAKVGSAVISMAKVGSEVISNPWRRWV